MSTSSRSFLIPAILGFPSWPAERGQYQLERPDRDAIVLPGKLRRMSTTFTAAVTHEGSWFVARCLEIEIASQGETAEEALHNLREAMELYFEDVPLPENAEPLVIAKVELSA